MNALLMRMKKNNCPWNEIIGFMWHLPAFPYDAWLQARMHLNISESMKRVVSTRGNVFDDLYCTRGNVSGMDLKIPKIQAIKVPLSQAAAIMQGVKCTMHLTQPITDEVEYLAIVCDDYIEGFDYLMTNDDQNNNIGYAYHDPNAKIWNEYFETLRLPKGKESDNESMWMTMFMNKNHLSYHVLCIVHVSHPISANGSKVKHLLNTVYQDWHAGMFLSVYQITTICSLVSKSYYTFIIFFVLTLQFAHM